MGFDLHTVEVGNGGAAPAQLDRLIVGLFRDIAFPASAAAMTALGAITAGTGYDVLPTLTPSGGTETAGTNDPAIAVATSLKCVSAAPATPGSGVAINDTFVLAGGAVAVAGPYGNGSTSANAETVLTVSNIEVVSATMNAGGTGGTNGPVTITGTSGTGTKFEATGTISGGVLQPNLVVTVAGDYTVGPTSLTAEPVTGGSLSGATVALKMGAQAFTISTAGGYTVAPPTPNTPTNGTGTGTGVTATVAFGLGTALLVHSGNYSAAPSFSVASADGNGSGASVATGTLGGSGAAIPRQVVGALPVAYIVHVDLNGQGGASYTLQKENTGFTVALVPPSTTLAAGTFDALAVG